MRKIEAKSAGVIAFFVLSLIALIIGAIYKVIYVNSDPSGFYSLSGGLFVIGIIILVLGKGPLGSFHWKM